MGSVTKSIFGGSDTEQSNSSQGGFNALPADLQQRYRTILSKGNALLRDPSKYFAPQDISQNELQALGTIQGLLDPSQISAGIQGFMNPYMDIVTSDINRQFEAPQGALASQASEAGAFGGSRYRKGQGDLERARLDAIAAAQSGNFNNALTNYLGTQQQGISNLLGFGQLERGIDLARRQALPQALQAYMGLFSPSFNASQTQGQSQSSSTGGLAGFFGG